MKSLLAALRGKPAAATQPLPASYWTVMTEAIAGNPDPNPLRTIKGIDELRALCPDDADYLYRLLRLVALHRTVVIQQKLLATWGPVVQDGPFAGMKLAPGVKEGSYIPKLLGCYECGLHNEWMRILRHGYDSIVNIGCADGYYAVGLARLLPGTRVFGYDLSPEALASCRQLAELNGVASRLQLSGEFHGKDFARHTDRNTLIICDIEGAERELLDPARFHNLRSMDLLVELHESTQHHTDTLIESRFAATHDITRIEAALPSTPLPVPLREFDELDRLLALWEWRIEPTPWMVMRVKTT